MQSQLQTQVHRSSTLGEMMGYAKCGTGGPSLKPVPPLLESWRDIKTESLTLMLKYGPSQQAHPHTHTPTHPHTHTTHMHTPHTHTPHTRLILLSSLPQYTCTGGQPLPDYKFKGSIHQAMGRAQVLPTGGHGGHSVQSAAADVGLPLAECTKDW